MDSSSYGLTAETLDRFGHAAFYQQFFSSLIYATRNESAVRKLGSHLMLVAERAQDMRQTEVVKAVSRLLLETPLVERYESVGSYCGALVLDSAGEFGKARAVTERAFDALPVRLKSKALLTLSGGYVQSGDLVTFLKLNLEASHTALIANSSNFRSFVTAQRNISIFKALTGDHVGALNTLEQSLPVARLVGEYHPYVYLEHLNSIAVELMELGRLTEAQRVISWPMASPIAATQPNWYETARDIALKLRPASRPMVTIPANRTEAPARKTTLTLQTPFPPAQRPVARFNPAPARIVDLQKWKDEAALARPRALARLTETERRTMPTNAKLIRIVDLLTRDETDDVTIDRALVGVEDVIFGEDPAV